MTEWKSIDIQHLVICPKLDSDVSLDDCLACEHYGSHTHDELECNFETEEEIITRLEQDSASLEDGKCPKCKADLTKEKLISNRCPHCGEILK